MTGPLSIGKLLIANRGEIARRIGRTCARLALPYVAVHSDADRGAPHLDGAAQVVRIGPAPAARSYLDGAALIRAARETGADAIHPGVGFLAENADFAAAVEAAGLIFVGPRPDTIAALGDKARAKALMAKAGVPVVPGADAASDDVEAVVRLIAATGLPALLKPVAGGGGKGMQVVDRLDARAEIASAIRTARSSFGDGRLLVERLIERPRHVEVQVFGDGAGGAVHLFDRECSLQRRHQKVIEEAPAASLPDDLRARLAQAAVAGAKAVKYRNAGTFEFIVGADGAFYYLEVNTRLQVEHPVTEAITGLDLVEWQLRLAAGAPLPLPQEQIRARGHAVECRLYAEDPAAGFRPAPGRITHLAWPAAARVDSAVEAGSPVPPQYDPMIAKLIVAADHRPQALARMRAALAGTTVMGVATNLGFLAALMARPEVEASAVHTRFIDDVLPELLPEADPLAHAAVAGAALLLDAMGAGDGPASIWPSPWQPGGQPYGRRALAGAALGEMVLETAGGRVEVKVLAAQGGAVRLEAEGFGRRRAMGVAGARAAGGLLAGTADGRDWRALVRAGTVEVLLDGARAEVSRAVGGGPDAAQAADWAGAEMPGLVVAVAVQDGARVARGDLLAVVEAMKFENPVTAPRAGIVAEVACRVGQQVEAGQRLVRLAP
ncbi:biotin carboxylase N-terminal domain-containing protein [Xanthobacter sp. KR7-225]|uniref:acetyl/propionyl/methylcrotonyl-CoA carboxylase subunit alpha n=1 Tax=Xanthobacter sp. KR7-225 TaxID=3156613 RepID=UPI0032B4BB55